jgi:hypothetical protein
MMIGRRSPYAGRRVTLPARLPAAALVGALLAASTAAAQQSPPGHQHGAGDHAAHVVAGGAIQLSPHLRATPPRPATAADSARARAITDSLWRAIQRYRDVRAAGADGYTRFNPERRQRVMHFNRSGNAARNDSGFDPGRPTSLLYRRAPGGGLVLTGAMFTAPKTASLEERDARVPLGIAQWHLHTNVCTPKRGENARWRETRDGRPVFGPQGGISTRAACDAVGGQFRETEFNWMVHVDFAPDGTASWGHGAPPVDPEPVGRSQSGSTRRRTLSREFRSM